MGDQRTTPDNELGFPRHSIVGGMAIFAMMDSWMADLPIWFHAGSALAFVVAGIFHRDISKIAENAGNQLNLLRKHLAGFSGKLRKEINYGFDFA